MLQLIKKIDLTPDLKKIFYLSWPVMLGMILQSLLGTVDMIFISKLGTNELAAASLGQSATTVVFVMSTLVSAGTIALVTRSYGEGNMDKVKRYSSESFLLSAIIGGILSIICYIYTKPIIILMFNPEAKILDLSYKYLSVLFIGTIFVFLNSALRTIMQALGDTRTPLYVFGASNILNMLLAPLLIFVFHLGIRGAALAAVLSTIFSFVTINYILIKKLYNKSLKCFLASMKLEFSTSFKIFKIGGWACLQQLARPLTGMFMVRLVYEVGGKDGSAAFGAGGQVFNYTFIFLVGLSTAIAIMVGQSLGKGDVEGCNNIIREGIKLAVINMAIFSIPYFFLPGSMMRLFTTDANVTRIGVAYLRIVYLGVVFVIFPTIYGGVFQGAGDTFPPMISSIIANVFLKLPIAYILARGFHMGTNGVWISIALSVIIEAIIIVFFFKQNRWKERVI
ncbi:MATE family efflux transporter [Clostridium omnivorum]|uniref:Probable multidrug resistance protein NorM n=1 Tax=Clostridium omnivorum TaxID=1604902 RepID=A0ABQ5N750_9CLOT|nr:MATE family efflux transporter [Clostridium sp. E14]GLC31083.1 putative multidrug resistance protein NorM [Clostridium sp. E14]